MVLKHKHHLECDRVDCSVFDKSEFEAMASRDRLKAAIMAEPEGTIVDLNDPIFHGVSRQTLNEIQEECLFKTAHRLIALLPR